MLTMQDVLGRLASYWAERGCLTVQPMNTEVGAGTLNPATFLRVLGPEPWRVAYVEPSVRPDDSRYGENPNRIQTHTQFQVILKPEPGDPQELYLGSLAALGIDIAAHDIRFVEDNWASPALGAWGLGWEVWLDGLEITQFTYFQQAGGVNLDPPSVELTYGIERILMALQGVRHFKDIAYAPGITYGEVFGQAEYEMSRYYLDVADVAMNRALLDFYAGEARRMVDEGLPVPAHAYVLKCSHAFNILDSRGAVSTADRAAEFARMRRLAGDVARLWIARREELGHPLGVVASPPAAVADLDLPGNPGTRSRQLVVEIGTEEMPPAEARAALEQVERELTLRLAATRLRHGSARFFATPRRLVAIVDDVAPTEDDHVRIVKGPKVIAGFGPDGKPTQAAAGFAKSQGVAVKRLSRVVIGGVEHLAMERHEAGRPAPAVLAEVLAPVIASLRSAKNMRGRDPKLSFTRPIRWLLALWGDAAVPVQVSTLVGDRLTRVHRTAAKPIIAVQPAEAYLTALAASGIVVDHQQRRDEIEAGAQRLAATVHGTIDVAGDGGLLDQIVYLVEQPTPLLGAFDASYLHLPAEVLTTVMRKHQRYLPIRDADGRLLPFFIAVANGAVDEEKVRAGNESVLQARYEDAAFFYRADRALPLSTLRERLDQLTFTDRLGTVADRARRIGVIARQLGDRLSLAGNARQTLERAADLAKVDLGSHLVTEMTSLAGIMARDYAAHAGEPSDVAQALFELELPRQAGDDVPASVAGALLSLADRLDLLAGLSATVGLPTGSSDPFALRRAALGLVAVHRGFDRLRRAQPDLAKLSLTDGLATAYAAQPVPVDAAVPDETAGFLARRLEQLLLEEGQPVDRVRAVLPHASHPHLVDRLLAQLAVLAEQETFRQLVEALQRSSRIVPAGTRAEYAPAQLTETAEIQLHESLRKVRADLGDRTDLVHFTEVAGRIVDPINAFFDQVFVMVDDADLRQARLGLLAAVRDLGAGVLDWPHLRLDLAAR